MAKIAELKRYLNYEFSSGCYTGEDYKSFQTKYINYLKAMCRENHWQLVNVGKKPLLLFCFYQECGKQIRLHLHQRRQVFQQRMVRPYSHSHGAKRSRLQRRF